ncbi:hypothetical protein ACH4T9_12890 [Micromonospora sp. NPDC020750]
MAGKDRTDDKPLPPYDWAAKPPTKDTDAAAAQMLADKSRSRRW